MVGLPTLSTYSKYKLWLRVSTCRAETVTAKGQVQSPARLLSLFGQRLIQALSVIIDPYLTCLYSARRDTRGTSLSRH